MNIRTKWRSSAAVFLTSVVLGMLIVSLPMAIALTVLLTKNGSSSLTTSADTRSEQVARSVALHLESFMKERQADLAIIAQHGVSRPRQSHGASAGRPYGQDVGRL